MDKVQAVEGLMPCGIGEEYKDNDVQIVECEEYANVIARLSGLASVLREGRAKREALAQNVRHLAKASSKVQERVDELESMKRKLDLRESYLATAKLSADRMTRELAERKKLMESDHSLPFAANNLVAARSRLKEVENLLAGEGGHARLNNLRSIVTARRRCMVAQIAALYPLIPCSSDKQQCPAYAHSSHPSGDSLDNLPMTISGLHVILPPVRKESLYYDKREYETSATALGYVAHATSLLARYLDVRLRYPVKFQASRSYMQDFSPAVELPRSNGMLMLPSSSDPVAEFPLFSDGQDATRSAYAVFLLNKDLEQILNHLGASSVGPRHLLHNLHRIFRTILQDAS